MNTTMTPQETQLLKHLRAAGSVSGDEARNVLIIRRLPAVVYLLKKRGYKFTTARMKDSTGRPYTRYFLSNAHSVPADVASAAHV